MKPEKTTHDQWLRLAQRARADAPPPGDLPGLLVALRHEPLGRPSVESEFVLRFFSPRILGACAGVAVLCLAAAWWQGSELLQDAQLLGLASILPGGLF